MRRLVTGLACGLAGLVLAAENGVNILTLGACNDGSADISEIVNAATANGPLYLPVGIYKVTHPLKLKNPLCGAGYSRVPAVDASRTWLVSDMAATNGPCGVIEFGGNVRVNVENLNIRCGGPECGIRIAPCEQSTTTYINRIGIFDVQSYGLFVDGGGSRPIFAGDMTIFGKFGCSARSVAIHVRGACDCRFTNIEMMASCVGMEAFNGHTYCDNLHIWTGVFGPHEPGWWKQTRSVIVGEHANFACNNFYPDTSYIAIDAPWSGATCEISNIMYWEDGSVAPVKDRDGAFFRGAADGSCRLIVHGGLIGVSGTDARPGAMSRVYSPGQTFEGVMMKNDYGISPKNIDRLCLGSSLPDYTVQYATNGFCKVADILTVARTGVCQATVMRDDGAAWRIGVERGKDGQTVTRVRPISRIAEEGDARLVTNGDHVKVFVRAPEKPTWTARFTTGCMGDCFRPIDHGSLRTGQGVVRYRETLATNEKENAK